MVERIQEEESRNGIQSPGLVEPLTELARLYQDGGDQGLATAAVERARQIVHVNYGLYSLEEAPLMRRLIELEQAMGNVEAAWDVEQDLLALVDRHPGDLRRVPILREIAEKRISMLERYLAGEFSPEIVLGCYYSAGERHDGESCRSGSNRVMVGAILKEARSYYTKAIRTMLQNQQYSSPELGELQAQLLRNSYDYREYSLGAYLDVELVLQQLIAYEVANSVPLANRIDTLLLLADWELMFAHEFGRKTAYESAHDLYAHAYRELETADSKRSEIASIYAPNVPVVLPSFLPNPLVSEETAGSTGYIEVAFEITDSGKADDVEVLATRHAGRRDQKDLVRLIKRSSYRPRTTDGRFTDADRVVVRYYLNE